MEAWESARLKIHVSETGLAVRSDRPIRRFKSCPRHHSVKERRLRSSKGRVQATYNSRVVCSRVASLFRRVFLFQGDDEGIVAVASWPSIEEGSGQDRFVGRISF